MKKTLGVVAVMVSLAFVAGGCDKKKEEGAAPAATPQTAQPAPAAPVAKPLPQADRSVPLTSYIRLDSGKQLMFMYYALTAGPLDYEKIAREYSDDYRRTEDGFKKQDMMKVLRPRIDAAIEKARGERYFVYTYETTPGSSVLGQYDFNTKSFPVDQNIWSPSAASYFNDQPEYKYTFTNGEAFRDLKVEDAEVARKIEAMVTGYKQIKATVYAFVQEADIASGDVGKIRAQIVKMQFADPKGRDLLVK